MPKTTYATVTPMEGQYDQVPCCLFFQPEYRDLSLDAKLLYTRMLSLTSYASFKGREDKIGVYITMSRGKIMEYLGCAQQKATKVLRELLVAGLAQLDSGDNINKGRIYLKKAKGIITPSEGDFFHKPFQPRFTFWQLPRMLSNELPAGARLLYAVLNTAKDETQGICTKIRKLMLSERLGIDVRTLAKYLVQLVGAGLVKLSYGIKVAKAQGAIDDTAQAAVNEEEQKETTASLPPPAQAEVIERTGAQSGSSQAANGDRLPASLSAIMEKQREQVKLMVDYGHQLFCIPPSLHGILEKAINALSEMLYSSKSSIWVCGKNHSAIEIKVILRSFTRDHLRAVIDAFARQRAKIRDLEAWLKTVLVNSVLKNAPAKQKYNHAGDRKRKARSIGSRKSEFRIGGLSYPEESAIDYRARFKQMCDRLIE